ncbi:tyrosine-type recombinase/integrase [Candidatus Saccharibacteria bacterium]|nr:tyrosine-type recombinase/integrase [Candidatus Saccharibacteria bacterium]
MKISEAFDLYKNNYMFYKSHSQRVLQNHDYVKQRIADILGDKEVDQITLNDVQKWTCELLKGRQWNTVRNDVVRLRAVLKYLRLREVPCLNYELIPVPKREETTRNFLTEEEVTAMIDNTARLRNRFVISLFYSSGIRLSELISLDKDSIQNRTFQVVGKGNKLRICFIDKRTEDLMKEYLASRDDNSPALIISYLHKDRMTPTNIQLIIKNAARNAGISKKVTPHVLRHSFATNFIRNNGNIRYLSVMMGHASVNTTAIYSHVVDNDLYDQYQRYHSV